jgi:F0F1-type ATP synthase membrane subunit b/b'
MTVEGPGAAREQVPAMTSLPTIEALPEVAGGFEEQSVRDAFEAFRRHTVQLQAQLRVLQAAGRGAPVDPTGHAVRMDALHLIREAADFAEVLERDAQRASAAQLQRTEQEVRHKQVDIQQRDARVEQYRDDSEKQRNEILTAARNEARQLVAEANRDASKELREAEARGTRLLEQARHQATELTNATRAEVEQTLEWARAQASAIVSRAQQGAEQLLGAAGLGEAAANEVAESIVKSVEASAHASRAAEPEPPAAAERPQGQPALRSAPAEPAPEPQVEPAPTGTAEPTEQPAAGEPPAPAGSDDTNS